MGRWRRSFWFDEPTIWLLRSFFQPDGFKNDFEVRKLPERFFLMLRLLLPMFVFAFPLALLIRVGLLVLNSDLYARYGIYGNIMQTAATRLFVWDAIWAALASCVIVGLIAGLFSIPYGVSLGMASTLADGIVVNITNDTTAGVIYGLTFGLLLGLTFNSIGSIRRGGLLQTTLGIIGGILVGMLAGIFCGTLELIGLVY